MIAKVVLGLYGYAQKPEITRTKQREHGDYATNIALILAKVAKKKPRDIANEIVAHLPDDAAIESCEIAGPGFINFHLSSHIKTAIVKEICTHPASLIEQVAQKSSILIEFVSSNPTGPLHVGHGRSAAIGSTLANLYQSIGHDVQREYYVNDAGTQIDTLALTVLLRYCGIAKLPEGLYQGDYINPIASSIPDDKIKISQEEILLWVKAQEPAFQAYFLEQESSEEKDSFLARMIDWMRSTLPQLDWLKTHSYRAILNDIQADLETFRVPFDRFFCESDLVKNGDVNKAIDTLTQQNLTEKRDGALWFKATLKGDDKDRVLIKANGDYTYFATDLAYHWHKSHRTEIMMDIFGADHHGYIKRLQSGVQALNTQSQLIIRTYQFALLVRDGESISMSTRKGVFETIKDVYQYCGIDATRYFYMMRHCDQKIEFDLELARRKSQENPVYYIQYAHARICRIFETCQPQNNPDLSLLTEEHELDICQHLATYNESIYRCIEINDPYPLCQYLYELARLIHKYYNHTNVLKADEDIKNSRLNLLSACKIVLKDGLDILAIEAPGTM